MWQEWMKIGFPRGCCLEGCLIEDLPMAPRWRDRARKDLKKFGIEEGIWYKEAQERRSWRERCHAGLGDSAENRIQEDEMMKKEGCPMVSCSVPTSTALSQNLRASAQRPSILCSVQY